MDDELKRLRLARGQLKGTVTRMQIFVADKDKLTCASSEMLLARKDKLVTAYREYENLQVDILALDPKDNEDVGLAEARYFSVLSMLTTQINNLKAADSQASGGNNSKLPSIDIPTFNGKDFTKYTPFIDLFMAIVDKNASLSDVQRLFYLRKFLADEALSVIINLPLVNGSYKEALDLLRKRYDNQSRLISCHVNTMLDLPVMSKGTAASIRSFISSVQQQLHALKNLKQPIDQWDMLLIPILIRKLDTYTNRAYQLDRDSEKLPTVAELIEFLEKRAMALEESGSGNSSEYHVNKNFKSTTPKVTNVATMNVKSCLYCEGASHPMYACPKFKMAPIDDRLNFVNNKKLCKMCLKKHDGRCKFNFSCRSCKGGHNTLLHKDVVEDVLNNHSQVSTHKVLLPTIKVKLFNKRGQEIVVKALLDSGSTASFVTSSLVDNLNLNPVCQNSTIIGIGNKSNKIVKYVNINVHSPVNNVQLSVKCHIVDSITSQLPQQKVDITKLNLPKNVMLSDDDFYMPSKISLLLGADVYFNILLEGQIKIQHGPVLQKTLFGYTIGGAVPDQSIEDQSLVNNFAICDNQKLEDVMEQFWLSEGIAEHKNNVNKEFQRTEKCFQETTTLVDNQFQVNMPLVEDIDKLQLGDSFSVALQRFLTLERKFKRCPSYYEKYKDFIEEYVAMGHAKIVDIGEYDIQNGPVYFLAHHAVINLESVSTVLRVVYDGSMKSKSGVSLNDVLLNGPVVQSDLFDILLLWRTFVYTLTCDVTKMFRAIRMNPAHAPLQNILWRGEPSEPIKCLQLQTVTYGLRPSSFLATRCLIELAQRYKDKYPLAAEAMFSSTYVDDVISGSDDQSNLIQLRNQLVQMLEKGGFKLHKWCSNLPEALDGLPSEHKYLEKLDVNKNNIVKTLGLKGDVLNDQLTFTCPASSNNVIDTKRKVLSYIGQMFDPLGLVGPIIVVAKLQMQRLWSNKNLNWDTILPQEELHLWNAFIESLRAMGTLIIPRCVNHINKIEVQLVGYCDASMKAFGCCLYLRILSSDGTVTTTLLCAKSRVCPLNKSITIPRLELSSALLLAQLAKKVHDILSPRFQMRVFLYSDSQITLAWIKAGNVKSNIYATNRVSQINSLTKDFQWLYVATSNNPADLLSRGCDPLKLKSNSLWWHGPSDLSNPNFEHVPIACKYPIINENRDNDDIDVNVCSVSVAPSAGDSNCSILNLINKISNMDKLQRIIAYMLRFSHNCKESGDKKYTGPLQPKELYNALITIISCIQHKYFSVEINALKNNVPLKSGIASLHPFLDKSGVLRVGGRLQNATKLPYSQIHPAILPKHCHLTSIIIQKEHMRLKHAGARAVLGSLSERYWIISGICQVKNTVRKCIICAKLKFKAAQQLMGSLPKERLDAVRPFQITGVDFCGHFNVKVSRLRRPLITKGYVAVFVCFATKAIHLELVSDLTTEAFLACLKRFIARRGMPSKIFCDNAKTFKGASNELKRLHDLFTSQSHINAIDNYCLPNYIHFKFIPSYAPEFGGLWEAGVKSFKHHFKRIVGNTVLTFEGLYTVITEIEAILNSRPLLPLNSDSSSCEYLSPGHFIIGKAMISYPEIDLSDKCINRLKFWNMLTKIKQDFWKIWSRDYLTQLQNRPKWKQSHPNLKEGDLVIVRSDNTPPLTWPMARIVKTIPGPDGRVRVVEVKMNNKIYTRSLQKICPLPISA